MATALVDLETNRVHAESDVIRNTTRCGLVITGPFMRVSNVQPLDMITGDELCADCYGYGRR
jgi:hypothetical protein